MRKYLHKITVTAIACLISCGGAVGQTVTKLSTDQYNFVEGPTWDGRDNVYFTDVNGNAIIKYSTSKKTFKTLVSNTKKANGMMFNTDNTLVVCEGEAGNLGVRDTNGIILRTLATTYNTIRFNSPNDLCIDGKGGVYFSDPTWGTMYQSQNRMYYRNAAGTITALITDMQKPNGVLLSADGGTLYIDDSWSKTIRSYSVLADGTLNNKKDFALLQLTNPNDNISGADGMALDVAGNLYVACKRGVQVFDKNGLFIKNITFPETPTNCEFGGANMTTLFVTAGKNLYSMENTIKGVRHPFDYNTVPQTKPILSFTNLVNNQEIASGTDLNPNVSATHSSGIANVVLYVDNVFLRQESQAPYDWGLGANDPTLNTLAEGQHTLKAIATAVSGEVAETSISITIVKIVTGLENNHEEVLNTYPNPVVDVLHFSKPTKWELLTSNGLKIEEGMSEMVDMGALSAGTYLVSMNGIIKKVVKK